MSLQGNSNRIVPNCKVIGGTNSILELITTSLRIDQKHGTALYQSKNGSDGISAEIHRRTRVEYLICIFKLARRSL